MKVGFEREFFVKAQGKFVLCPQIMNHDECGYLAESRGEPHDDPLAAAYLLMAREEELVAQAKRNRVQLVKLPYQELEVGLLREALNRYGKGPVPGERGNIYGLDYSPEDTLPRAGLHVHFSNQIEVKEEKYSRNVNGFLDIPKIILKLDKAFEEEIKNARRLLGCYEVKLHGFEYRSLPATTDPRKVAWVISH